MLDKSSVEDVVFLLLTLNMQMLAGWRVQLMLPHFKFVAIKRRVSVAIFQHQFELYMK